MKPTEVKLEKYLLIELIDQLRNLHHCKIMVNQNPVELNYYAKLKFNIPKEYIK